MFRKIRHSLKCLPRRHCSCDSGSDSSVQVTRPRGGGRPKHPVAKAPNQALRQPLPKNVGQIPAPAESQASNEDEANEKVEEADEEIELEGIGGEQEEEEEVEVEENEEVDDAVSSEKYDSAANQTTNVSHVGITPVMSGVDIEGESSSSDEASTYSLSIRYPHADGSVEVSDLYSNKSSSGDNFHSVRSQNSHTGITPEMSDVGLAESQYHSFPESGGSSFPVSMTSVRENSTDEESYNGADEDSSRFDQIDEEMHDDTAEHEEQIRSWQSSTSDRRRRRSIDNQARADAEYRNSHGSDGTSKRQRVEEDCYPNTGSGSSWASVKCTSRDVFRFRRKGAQYKRWIDDPEEYGCTVYPATLTIEQMTDKAQPLPWVVQECYPAFEPVELEGGDVESMNIVRGSYRYRYTYLRRDPGPNSREANEFEHLISRGVLIARRIWKHEGPYWSDVARAQYLLDYNLKTLRHVVICDIWNEETATYIREELYPRFGVTWAQAEDFDCMVFEHGSTEYHELLGTKLGRGVACLVLSSFPRGTMKITEIVTWCFETMPQMRFVIEPVIPAAIAVATAA